MYTFYRLLTISSLYCITGIIIRNKTVDIVVFDILSVEMDDLSLMIMIVINLTPPPQHLYLKLSPNALRSSLTLMTTGTLPKSSPPHGCGFDTLSTINYPKV